MENNNHMGRELIKKRGGRPKRQTEYESLNAIVTAGLKSEIKKHYPAYGQISAFVERAIRQELLKHQALGQNAPDAEAEASFKLPYFFTPEARDERMAFLDKSIAKIESDITGGDSEAKIKKKELRILAEYRALLAKQELPEANIDLMFEEIDAMLRQDRFERSMIPLGVEYVVFLRTYLHRDHPGSIERAAEIEERLIEAVKLVDKDENTIRSQIKEIVSTITSSLEKKRQAREREWSEKEIEDELKSDDPAPTGRWSKLKAIFK